MKMKRSVTMLAAGLAATALAGCKPATVDTTSNYKAAINAYYASRPACLWAQSQKLPVQVDTSDTTQTTGYDALVDQGLLQRTTDEKKRFLIGSKQVTNYDLSQQGRGAWTPDQQQPGFGNFCYGTFSVTTIDSSTATNAQPGSTTTVAYHARLTSVPAWASAPETQTAYPQVASEVAGPIASSATLTDTDNGWTVTKGPSVGGHPRATNADGSIVQ